MAEKEIKKKKKHPGIKTGLFIGVLLCLAGSVFALNNPDMIMDYLPGIARKPVVQEEIIDFLNAEIATGALGVAPETGRQSWSYLELVSDGFDIYTPPGERSGYRYGPSIIKNENGSLDIWFSSPGNNSTEWDYIRYMHMYSNGKWSKEKVVLKPSPGTLDHFSCCDPGVIYFDGYYYLAYTSTSDYSQFTNHLYVARSVYPDGPFEKWDGSGWGGNPVPIVAYTESDGGWGAGEASFTVKGDTLYIYYTYNTSAKLTTRVATATVCENWPATMVDHGAAFIKTEGEDSFDVLYVDDIDHFVAFSVIGRMTGDSGIVIYESENGINFTKADVLKSGLQTYIHNMGVSKGKDGHISLDDTLVIGYAYDGYKWSGWPCRLQEIKLDAITKIWFK